MIDCLTLETVYLGAYAIQKSAIAIGATYVLMASVVLSYHSATIIKPIIITNAMLIPTSNFLNVEADKKTGEAINSIKIDYSKMVFSPKSSDKFTECRACGALLIEEVPRSL